MKEKRLILLRLGLRGIVLALVIVVLIREATCHRPKSPPPTTQGETSQLLDVHTYITVAFDTQCTISLWGEGAVTDAVATEAIQALNNLHNCLNRYDKDSEVSRFNALPPGTPFQCSDLLWTAFTAARDAHRKTSGTFDVTIGPLMAFWKKAAVQEDDTPLDDVGLKAAMDCVGFEKLLLDDAKRTVTKAADGLSVDFGGLAKGLALDLVRPLCENAGIDHLLLDFGGNLYLSNPENQPNAGQVWIRDPRTGNHEAGKMLGKLTNANRRCVATSANSERPIATGKRPIGHLMNPFTGKPAMDLDEVTAVTLSGVDSDVFSTAVFIGGFPLAEKLARQIPDAGFLLLPTGKNPQTIGAVDFISE